MQFRGVRPGVAVRLVIGLILLVCAPAGAQPTTAPAAGSATTQPGSAVEQSIRAALPDLARRASGLEAVARLQALRDVKVLQLFERIKTNAVYKWNDQYVVAREKAGDKDQREIFDLFVPADETGAWVGQPIAVVTKEELPDKNTLDVNKAVRTEIINTLRVLGLKIDDPRVRRRAARGLGLYQQTDALPELRAIAQNDPDKAVRREANAALHMITVGSMDPSVTPQQKIDAAAQLDELDFLPALDRLRELNADPETPAELKPALQGHIDSIETHGTITKWLQTVFSGLSLGSIYVLLALGLAITFGLMGVINMAHGEMLMLGGVTTWACCEFIGKALPPEYFDWYYVIAFPLSFLVAAGFGLLIETSIVRWLYKRPLDSLLATIGVSYILIQLVRNQFSDNLSLRTPSWANGNWEIIPDVVLGYARLFVIGLTVFCVAAIVLLFRFTRIGLMVRATVQNREMAQALGVNTRRVDMFTFAIGAGLAGLAGYGIVLTGTNPTPEMGQTFVVKTFLTVVVGGVGKLVGVIVSGLGLGFMEKLLEPIVLLEKPVKIFDATWAEVATLLAVLLFMLRKPSGLFPDKGRAADQADRTAMPFLAKPSRRGEVMLGVAMLFVGLVVVPSLYLTGMMSLEFLNKLGYILCLAICAIGLDLIWGYIGVLSLCQFMFFTIGGYCMGLYLINYGPQSEDGIPMALSYVMSDVGARKAPWFLPAFMSFPVSVFLGLLLPGLLALLIGLLTFRSRVRGVYFSILTQAITVGAWLIFQKNEMKLGGTNGLTNFTHILGYEIAGKAIPVRGEGQGYSEWLGQYSSVAFSQTRFWLYIVSFLTLMLAILVAKKLVNSGFGRVLVAIRDDETRLRFVGYQTWAYKAAAFALAAMFGAIGGMLYVPQKGIITPTQMGAAASILVVAWVAVGGRGTLWGAVFGAIFVGLVYDYITSIVPEYWYFVLGGLFVAVPLLLPGGLMSLPKVIGDVLNKNGKPTGIDLGDAKPAAQSTVAGGH
jgi:urea transport system permease protein